MRAMKDETNIPNFSPMNQYSHKKTPINLNSTYRPISAAAKRTEKILKQNSMRVKHDFPTVFKGLNTLDYSVNLPNKSHMQVPSTTLEKEKLYEETIYLKKMVNGLKIELASLRSENLKKENEINRKDKVIEDIVVDSQNNLYGGNSIINSPDMMSKVKDANLLFKLKKQFKDMKKEFKEKCEENENLKKLVKVTKFNELNIEVKTLTEELNKIKTFYLHSLQQNEMNENNLKEMQSLQDNFTKQHFIILSLQENIGKINEDLKQKDVDFVKLKNLLDEKNIMLKKVKKELQLHQNMNERMTKEKSENKEVSILKRSFENQIAELNREVNRYRSIADSKDRELKDFMKRNKSENTAVVKNTFNYNDLKYSQPNPEQNFDSQTLLLKSKLQEQLNENENLVKKVRQYEKKIEILEKEYGFKLKNTDNDTDGQVSSSPQSYEHNPRNPNSNSEKDQENSPRSEYLVDDQMLTEFTYILIKNFEAKKITRTQASQIVKEICDLGIDNNSIKKLSIRIFNLLKVKNEEEQIKIINFFNTLLIQSNKESSYTSFEDKFLSLFDNVKIYTQKEELELSKKLKKYLKNSYDNLHKALQAMDYNKSGLVTFLNFRKILELINISLKDKYIEYLIYVMKSSNLNTSESSIYDLNYDALFKLIKNAPDDSKVDSSEDVEDDEYMNNEESEIVITSDQFNSKINNFLNKLSDYLKTNKTNVYDLFKGEIFRPSELESTEEFKNIDDDVVDLKTFLTEMKKIGVQMGSLDVYCIYTKLKIIEDFEAVSLNVLEKELKSFEAGGNSNSLAFNRDRGSSPLDLEHDEMNIANLDQVLEDEEDYSKYSFEENEQNKNCPKGFISNRVEKDGAKIEDVLMNNC